MKIDEYQSPRLVRLGNVRDVTGTGSINKVGAATDSYTLQSGVLGSFTTVTNSGT
ncbi:MAG: lasso RiPP family leader peptide-containing protein [Acidimicrobiales bacterium]